jgi:hypothetical protein
MTEEKFATHTLDEILTMQFLDHIDEYNTGPDGKVDLSSNLE